MKNEDGGDKAPGIRSMPYFAFVWNDELVEHIAEHGISQDDFERVVCNPSSKGYSRSSGLPAAWGYTADGRYIVAVYEQLDELKLLPVTAYEVPEPR
jgi:hypothetical protein